MVRDLKHKNGARLLGHPVYLVDFTQSRTVALG